jgi:hypothetical protein
MEPKAELTQEEGEVLVAVERAGAISPSRLSAQMQIAPTKMWEMLEHLQELKWAIIRDDPDSADGKLVIATGTNMASQSKAE